MIFGILMETHTGIVKKWTDSNNCTHLLFLPKQTVNCKTITSYSCCFCDVKKYIVCGNNKMSDLQNVMMVVRLFELYWQFRYLIVIAGLNVKTCMNNIWINL